MAGYQNLHTHTTYCDGALPPEGMVKAVLERNGGSIGFSEHAHVSFDLHYSMTPDKTAEYIDEIRILKETYKDTIDIFLGLEMDIYSEPPPAGLDYTIGTSHYIIKDGDVFSVDAGSARQQTIADTYYNGDYYTMAEEYFSLVSKMIKKTNANIVGHFDLVTKYNFNGCKFDESHPRYINAALSAMDELLEDCKLFEVNTGAMYRQGKTEPYPSVFLLRELCKRGGEVLLTSDSHTAESLFYKFDEIRELLKNCGFKYIKKLTTDGFIDEKL